MITLHQYKIEWKNLLTDTLKQTALGVMAAAVPYEMRFRLVDNDLILELNYNENGNLPRWFELNPSDAEWYREYYGRNVSVPFNFEDFNWTIIGV